MGKRKRKSRAKAETGKAKLGDIAQKFNMSIPGIHHEIKRIINKIVDRLKPCYFEAGAGVFDIVLDLSEKLGCKNHPQEIFKKLNAKNKLLCVNEAKKRAPHLAKILDSEDEEDLMEE